LGIGIKMIKVCLAGESCTGSDAHYLTVEARASNKPYERGVPGEGVIIHDFRANRGKIGTGDACFFNTQSGWAVPIDATPGDYRGDPNCDTGGRSWPNYGLGNAEFLPGDIYSDSALHVSIKVVKKSKSSYVVKVTRSQ